MHAIKTAAPAVLALLFTVAVILYPAVAFQASVGGLKLWFDIVLPALLPFFAMSEVLAGLGVIHGLGVLLEPLMRPVFRIPGVGAFAVAMGLASGYPLGAKISGGIRRQGLCTQLEAERLISFANTADPLFMSGAVAVGMFAAPELGAAFSAAHYLAVIIVGFLMRFHGGGAMGEAPEGRPTSDLLARAGQAAAAARASDGRPFGQLFADAVRESITSMLFIGGCIMMFSVFIRVLAVAGITGALAHFLAWCLAPLSITPDLIQALLSGSVEITLGAQSAGAAAAPLAVKAAVASAIIAWSGLSVHAQVAAMVHGTDIRLAPYLWARLLHAMLAAGLTALLLGPAESVLGPLVRPAAAPVTAWAALPIAARFTSSLLLLAGLMGGAALLGWGLGSLPRRR